MVRQLTLRPRRVGTILGIGLVVIFLGAGILVARPAPPIGPAGPSRAGASGLAPGAAAEGRAEVVARTRPDGSPAPMAIQEVGHAVSPAARSLPLAPLTQGRLSDQEPSRPLPLRKPRTTAAALVQSWFSRGAPAIPAPSISWDGVNNLNAVYPPDTNGDVGLNHYVQWVNLSLQIWDKSGNSLVGPINGNGLFGPLGAPCGTRNDGDPIVLYDQLADRWLLTQFAVPGGASGYHQCLAVSTSGDPTGSYNIYDFKVSATLFDDYPKFGVWPDAYYASFNMFNGNTYAGPEVWAFNRTAMLNGQAATAVLFGLSTAYYSLIPGDMDGSTLPPAGAPGEFASEDQSLFAIDLWKFHVDFVTPGNSTLTGPTQLATGTFTDLCPGTRNCVPQPGTAVGLDGLGVHAMYRLAYRNFGDHESWVFNNAANVSGAGVQGAPHWYELRSTPPGSALTLAQESSYAPDATSRWMASLAMDHFGDMGMGYSASDGTSVRTSIRYTARLITDTANLMTQGEGTLMAGSGVQTGPANRWGDYSMMTVDPRDDCTFWYTNEYLATTGTAPWRTRIGAFKLPSCVIQSTSALTGTGAALSAPGILWTGAGNSTQIFIGSNSGAKQVYSVTASLPLARVWTQNLNAANQQRGPIVTVNGAARVFETSQDGWVTGLNTADGSLYWQKQIAGSVVASPAFRGGTVGPTGHGLIYAGTFTNTALANNLFYALDASTGATAWSFTGPLTASLGVLPTAPYVDWTNNIVYFGSQDVTGGTGHGVWSLNALTGALRWVNTSIGGVVNSAPTLSADGLTLYVGTVNGATFTLYALRTVDGSVRWSFATPGQLQGAVWAESGSIYASAGNQVYAFTDNGIQTSATPKWAGPAAVPGAGTPLSLSGAGNPTLYVAGNNGNLYRLNNSTGSLIYALKVGPTALSDATYDTVRNALYVTVNGILYSLSPNFTN
ncbi:MAG TPA: PQQ-binding-like beta-propeller repeat protein [Chloroflexia bacterium]|nr:PQQ-binding-like beta-propeller repeat protein [Chloroflexia bacterium]